ncbi:MAG: bifunctional UDP-N-acetylmuramoyl-tripeptide:D-alanyl-D-alanine ligase/alanine racemase, partial [Pedobacter sp.]
MIAVNYTFRTISENIDGTVITISPEAVIRDLAIDSRVISDPVASIFFAIKGRRDGHDYISDAYNYGVRSFVVEQQEIVKKFPDANFIIVNNTLTALHELVAKHRSNFDLKVIGITGSNGKTIVKEWLYQLLAIDHTIVRSPKSYNSQIGVPLSVWQINKENDLGIFEAGISSINEMRHLEEIIKPTIGVLTNLTDVHAQGFASKDQKLEEKLSLFSNVSLFIYSPDYITSSKISIPGKVKFTWSTKQTADLQVFAIEPIEGKSYLRATYRDEEIECLIPFSDKAAIENGIICWATLLATGYSPEEADKRLEKLLRVGMRLELKNGINNCSVIDDSYSADISSLAIALDFLNQQNQHVNKTVILSDIYQTGKTSAALYEEVALLLHQKNIGNLIGIGPDISANSKQFTMHALFFESTESFIRDFPGLHFNNESILVKGSRKFEFERISKLLTQKIHDTILEIDLTALAANLNFYKSRLQPKVKIMAMVKAFSYGSGSFEIANLLQFHKVDY